ncbi:MAG: redoxin domain-containing protein [Treponema sp.]|nr:redoxin domain-containing protein [Treponema sp.]
MNENLSIFLAFGAGLLSFLSPCILPLIPSYLCVIGGAPMTAGAKADAAEFRPRLVARTVSFILGFSAVFIALSIIFTVTFGLMGGIFRYINIISGVIVITLGLHFIFDFISFLNYEKKFHLTNKIRGIPGAFAAGSAFGAGWTPCVGPALAGILLLAAQAGGIPRAVLYLACYSAGLGLPFLLASVFFNTFLKTSVKLRSHLPLIRRVSGALLIIIGVTIITGHYQALNALTAKWQAGIMPPSGAANSEVNYQLTSGRVAPGNDTADNTVPDEVLAAFRRAGIPVVASGIDPVDFTLPLLNGKEISLSELTGKVVFLNFWATWCGPCRMEMPSMEAVYQKLKNRGFEILAINLGERQEDVSAFMKEYSLSFPTALDARGFTGSIYGAQAIPTTYIIDRRGLIVSRLVGSIDWNTPEIISALESLL